MSDLERLGPLDEEIAALVRAERTRPGMPADAQSRLLDRLQVIVGPGAPSAPAPASPPPPRLARQLPLTAAALIVGGLGGAALHARFAAPRPVLAPVAVATVPVELPAPAPPPSVPEQTAAKPPSHRPSTRALAPPDPAGARDTELAAERSLIERARSAMSRGNHDGCLEALALHRERFPLGQLREERETLWIQALVQQGRYGEARQRALAFHRQFPSSFLAPVVDAALQAIP